MAWLWKNSQAAIYNLCDSCLFMNETCQVNYLFLMFFHLLCYRFTSLKSELIPHVISQQFTNTNTEKPEGKCCSGIEYIGSYTKSYVSIYVRASYKTFNFSHIKRSRDISKAASISISLAFSAKRRAEQSCAIAIGTTGNQCSTYLSSSQMIE